MEDEDTQPDRVPDAPNSANFDSNDIMMEDRRVEALQPLVAGILLGPPRTFEPSEKTFRVLIVFPEEEESEGSSDGLLVVTPVGASIGYVLEAVQPRIEHRFGRDATVTLHDTSGELARLERVTRSGTLPLQTTNLPDSIRLDGIIHRRIHRRPPVDDDDDDDGRPKRGRPQQKTQKNSKEEDILRCVTSLHDSEWKTEGHPLIGRDIRRFIEDDPTYSQGKVVGWLSAAESDFVDAAGRPAELFKVKYTTGELAGDHEDLELHEVRASYEKMSPEVVKSLWGGVQQVTKKFYELVKAGDETVRAAIETSRKLIDKMKEVREANEAAAAAMVKETRAAWTEAARAAGGTVHSIQLQQEDDTFGFDYDHTRYGPVVKRVKFDGAAARDDRLRHGDVITNIQGKHIKDLDNGEIDRLIEHGANANGDLLLHIVRLPPVATYDAGYEVHGPAPGTTFHRDGKLWVVFRRGNREVATTAGPSSIFDGAYYYCADDAPPTEENYDNAKGPCSWVNINQIREWIAESDGDDRPTSRTLRSLQVIRAQNRVDRVAPETRVSAKIAEKRLLEALAKNVEERLVSDFPALRSNQLVSFERFKTVIAQNPSWLENEPREELAGLTKSIIRSFEASVRTQMADDFARVDAALARKNLENWKDLPVPDADAIARAQRAATTDLADGMIDSDDETTLCAEPMQWRLGLGTKPSPAAMVKVLNVVLPLIYVMNHTGVALASQTLGCTAVPDEFMDYCPRLFFMTMVCSVLHGFATGCLGREYAEGLFEAMHILHLKTVTDWLENPRDETETTFLPLDLLALIWTASACVYCRSRGWKAWSAWNAIQDGLLIRLCGAGSEGFGIPAFFFISGIYVPEEGDPEGPLTARVDQEHLYKHDALTGFIRAIGEGMNLTWLPLLCLFAECTGRAKSIVHRAFPDREFEDVKACVRWAHVYTYMNAQIMLDVFPKYRFDFAYALRVAVDIYGPRKVLRGNKFEDLVAAAEKGILDDWEQYTFCKWCCWPWPLPVVISVCLPRWLGPKSCARIIATLVSQQHDAAAPHYSDIFGWPCWWWDLWHNFSALLSKPSGECSSGATHECRWWYWLWLTELKFINRKWTLREKKLKRSDLKDAKLDDDDDDVPDSESSDNDVVKGNIETRINKMLARLGDADPEIYGEIFNEVKQPLTLEFMRLQWLAHALVEVGPPTSITNSKITGYFNERNIWVPNPIKFKVDQMRNYVEAMKRITDPQVREIKVIKGPQGKDVFLHPFPLDIIVGPHYQRGRDYAGCSIIVDKFRADIMKFYKKPEVKYYKLITRNLQVATVEADSTNKFYPEEDEDEDKVDMDSDSSVKSDSDSDSD